MLIVNAPAFARISARATLNARIPAAKLDNVPLVDAVDFLRDITGANIVVDWKTLEALNISKDAQININLHDVTAAKLLSLMLLQAAPGDLLTYTVQDNVIEITSRAQADSTMITVVYYVEDLLQPNDTFNYQIQNPGGGSAQVSGSGGGGGGNVLSQTSNTQTNNTADAEAKLIKLIETVIRPEVWRDNGGNASMFILNGNLIVTAPISVQEAIGGPVNR